MLSSSELAKLKPKGASFWPADLLDQVLEAVASVEGVYRYDSHRDRKQPRQKPAGTAEQSAAPAGALAEVSQTADPRDGEKVPRAKWWRAFVLASRDTGLGRVPIGRIHRNQIAPNGVSVVDVMGDNKVIRLRSDTRKAMLPRPRPFQFPGSSSTFWKHWRAIAHQARLPRDLDVCPRWMDKAANHYVHPDEIPAQEITDSESLVTEFLDSVYFPLRLRGKSPRTLALYRRSIAMFAKHLERPARLTDFTDLSVSSHLHALEAAGKAPHTIDKERSQLLALWRFACDRRLLRHYPTIMRSRLPKRDPIAWTSDQLRQLFKAIDREPGELAGIPARLWWRALHLVMWDTSERIGALLKLTWTCLDLDARWVTIPAEIRKGKTGDETSRLHPDTVAALMAIRDPIRDLVFPWPHNYGYIWKAYGLIMSSAHLPNDRFHKFHAVRRSVASHFEAAGGNATRLLGHSSRAITERSYLDPRIVPQLQAADMLFRPYAAPVAADAD